MLQMHWMLQRIKWLIVNNHITCDSLNNLNKFYKNINLKYLTNTIYLNYIICIKNFQT